jgi:hypothetical protein
MPHILGTIKGSECQKCLTGMFGNCVPEINLIVKYTNIQKASKLCTGDIKLSTLEKMFPVPLPINFII